MLGFPSTTARGGKPLLDARGRLYEPAVGPRLRILLFLVLAATALLGISGVYLLAIRSFEWLRSHTYTNAFTLWMFVGHILAGVSIAVPFLAFGIIHYLKSRHRKNRLAVKLGLALFASGIIVVLTGLALIQLEKLPQLPTGSVARWVVWGLHVAIPLVAVLLYVLHRRAGPDINWRVGYAWGGAVAVFVAVMLVLHNQDPRRWGLVGPREGAQYFEPSKARTATGMFIPAKALMMDTYCMKCHEDIYKDHYHSAHRFSSFNNPAYLFSVRKTREFGMKRDGHPRASRWCAGCHDVVPFLSGGFDDPKYDDVNDPTAHAGITCVTCHAITNVNDVMGNGAYTIEEPEHYPWAYSDNPVLQWMNNQLIKARPDFHKKTFLKPFHRGATLGSEFCSTCHKVSLPVELNHYKEFLRGQNHHDSFVLSGVSGHGARSFYYPEKAKASCTACHMPLKPSNDFGARDFDGSGTRKVHDHLFPAANTGLPWLLSLDPKHAGDADGFRAAAEWNAAFLRSMAPDGKTPNLRIDLFGLKAGDNVTAPLIAPLRLELPRLKPGSTYLIEVVIRTLALGHHFTQGTGDSNEVWVECIARSGDRILGTNGKLAGPDDSGPLDEEAHRVNILMLDRHGNRIDRRNPEDIFTPLYDHQIPPGAGQVVHYRLDVPKDVREPIKLNVRLRYRKFDFEYMRHIYGDSSKVPKLPITDLCADEVLLPVEGGPEVPEQKSSIEPAWQRFNDYGIGLLLQRDVAGKKGELKQAAEVFGKLIAMGGKAAANGYVNRARVYLEEGRRAEAAKDLQAAGKTEAPWWTVAWLSGRVALETALTPEDFDRAIEYFERVVSPDAQSGDLSVRGFDFSKDYVVIGELGKALFQRSQMEDGWEGRPTRDRFLLRSIEQYNRVLALDPEDLNAHYGLHQCYRILGESRKRVTSADGTANTRRVPGSVEEDAFREVSRRLRAPQASLDSILGDADVLVWMLKSLGGLPLDALHPKRARLNVLLADLQPFFQQQTDMQIRYAVAHVLDELHRQIWLILKPDDLAQSHAVAEYRRKHPAADRAAEVIVIYPLH
jgi:tetratricopeptide (TPR) repeat protein